MAAVDSGSTAVAWHSTKPAPCHRSMLRYRRPHQTWPWRTAVLLPVRSSGTTQGTRLAARRGLSAGQPPEGQIPVHLARRSCCHAWRFRRSGSSDCNPDRKWWGCDVCSAPWPVPVVNHVNHIFGRRRFPSQYAQNLSIIFQLDLTDNILMLFKNKLNVRASSAVVFCVG